MQGTQKIRVKRKYNPLWERISPNWEKGEIFTSNFPGGGIFDFLFPTLLKVYFFRGPRGEKGVARQEGSVQEET